MIQMIHVDTRGTYKKLYKTDTLKVCLYLSYDIDLISEECVWLQNDTFTAWRHSSI